MELCKPEHPGRRITRATVPRAGGTSAKRYTGHGPACTGREGAKKVQALPHLPAPPSNLGKRASGRGRPKLVTCGCRRRMPWFSRPGHQQEVADVVWGGRTPTGGALQHAAGHTPARLNWQDVCSFGRRGVPSNVLSLVGAATGRKRQVGQEATGSKGPTEGIKLSAGDGGTLGYECDPLEKRI